MAQTDSKIVRFEKPAAGTFTVRDTAVLLRATTPPERTVISRWRNQRRPRQFAATSQALYSWIRNGLEWDDPMAVSTRDRVITFEDLIRLRVISFLRTRNFSYSDIRFSEDRLRQDFGFQQPFVTERLWIAGDLLVDLEDALMSVSPKHFRQTAFKDLREFFLPVEHGLSFDGGVASLWKPYRGVVIDPEFQFGAPCIEGTRIETEALWSFHQAGDSVESLARMYGLDAERIEAALAWEQRIADAMAA